MKAKASLVKQEAEIEATENEINAFFNKIVPDFINQAGGILSDRVRFWRWKKQMDIIKNAQEKIKLSGLTKQQIPLKVLVPIIQNSSLEEDSNMQNRWANMLANAATGNQQVSPNYAAILNELSPIEVEILDMIYQEVNKESDYQKRRGFQFDAVKLRTILELPEEKMDLIIENLFRLNLLQPPAGKGIMLGELPFALRTNKAFEFTTLGYEFVKACSWEVSNRTL